MKRLANKQPDQVCQACGQKYGSWFVNKQPPRYAMISTFSYGHCDVCNQDNVPVTEARDFGYLVEWQPALILG
jgi:hypothetical protein